MSKRCAWLAVLLVGCLGLGSAAAEGFVLDSVGFESPESVVHDAEADLYLVSNVNGDPSAKDGNGFISRVSPAGQVVELKWIDGQADGVTLHAPKGIAIHQDCLYVADIDVVRVFDRQSGEPLDTVPFEGAVFLNDVAVSPDGRIVVSDPTLGFVYQAVIGGTSEQLAVISGCNGVVATVTETYVASWTRGSIYRIVVETGKREKVAGVRFELDGLILLDDGTLLTSSWQSDAVHHVRANGKWSTPLENLPSPGDIGLDLSRGMLLVPLFEDNALVVLPLPPLPAA